MAYQIQQTTTHRGYSGLATSTLMLLSREEFEQRHNSVFSSKNPPIPLSETLQCGRTHITVRSPFTQEELRIPIEELRGEFTSLELSNTYVYITHEFKRTV